MKAPKNISDFKTVLKNMNHRERFIFELKENRGSLEVYYTYTQSGYGSANISLSIVDQDGTSKPTNRLLKNWSESYYKQVFELLKQAP